MQRTAAASAARHAEIASKEDEANPFSPTTDIYLRPAMDKDANSVAMIYNHYVSKCNVTEDQATILDSDASFLITNARTEKLPFIVAVKGREPPQTDAQGRPGAGNKAPRTTIRDNRWFRFRRSLQLWLQWLQKGPLSHKRYAPTLRPP
jgi:hypothetical protein